MTNADLRNRYAYDAVYREVMKARARAYYVKADKERIKKRVRARYANNPAVRASMAAAYRVKMAKLSEIEKEARRVVAARKMREWRRANPELTLARGRESAKRWRARHPEWYSEHKEQAKAYGKKHKNKCDYCRARHADRSAARRAMCAENIDRWAVAARDNWRCAYCEVALNRRTLTIDHVLALARGGAHTWDNVTACCLTCNTSKGDKLLKAWLSEPDCLAFRSNPRALVPSTNYRKAEAKKLKQARLFPEEP